MRLHNHRKTPNIYVLTYVTEYLNIDIDRVRMLLFLNRQVSGFVILDKPTDSHTERCSSHTQKGVRLTYIRVFISHTERSLTPTQVLGDEHRWWDEHEQWLGRSPLSRVGWFSKMLTIFCGLQGIFLSNQYDYEKNGCLFGSSCWIVPPLRALY